MDFAANQLKAMNLESFVIQKGDKLPSFELHSGWEVHQKYELLSKGSYIN